MRRNIREVSTESADSILLIAEDAVDKVTDLDQRERVANMPADSQPVAVLLDIATEAHAEITQQDKSSNITPADATAATAVLKRAHQKTISDAEASVK